MSIFATRLARCLRVAPVTRCVVGGLCTTTPTPAKITRKSTHLKGTRSTIHHYYDYIDYTALNTFVARDKRIQDVDNLQLDELLSMMKRIDHQWSDIEEHKDILFMIPFELNRRLKTLEDYNINKPTVHEVFYFQAYQHCSVGFLIKHNIFPEHFDLPNHLLEKARCLHLPEDFKQDFIVKFSHRDVLLSELYGAIFEKYMCMRFPSEAAVIESVFRDNWVPPWRPISSLPALCDVIIDKLNMTFSQVVESPPMFELEPDNVVKLLTKFPSLGGTSTRDTATRLPGLIVLPYQHVERWVKLLWKYHVKNFKITNNTLILIKKGLISDAEKILQVLTEIPEWEVIALSDQLFTLLRAPHLLKKFLDSSHSGTATSLRPQPAMHDPDLPSTRRRRLSSDMVAYIARELEVDEVELGQLVNTEVLTHFGIANTRMVLELLLDYGFTRDQVLNGIQLLGFEFGVVKEALLELPSRPEAQPFDKWMDSPHVLHLLAYMVKKDSPHLNIRSEH